MKYKIELDKVEGYEFEGWVSMKVFTKEQLEKLNLSHIDNDEMVEVCGEYLAKFKDKEVEDIIIERIVAVGSRRPALHDRPVFHSILMDKSLIDTQTLADEIYNKANMDMIYNDRKNYINSLHDRE